MVVGAGSIPAHRAHDVVRLGIARIGSVRHGSARHGRARQGATQR